jgi:hypothetical protein
METTALYSVAYAAVVSAAALLYAWLPVSCPHCRMRVRALTEGQTGRVVLCRWARRRTKRSFKSFILSRVLGESTGTYPISLESVTRKGDALRVKSDGLKAVRKHVVDLAGLQAVQASLGLVLSSAVTSYAIKRWSDGTN